MMHQRAWLRGDLCITPLGHSARVVRWMPDGRLEVAYVGRPCDTVTLAPKLLRPWPLAVLRQ